MKNTQKENPCAAGLSIWEKYAADTKMNRRICCENFWGKGEHLYKDELGWACRTEEISEARSFIPKKIFQFNIVEFGWNISFYYPENDTFYGIHTEEVPVVLKKLPKIRRSLYRGLESDGNTHRRGWPLQRFKSREELWDGIKINGKSLEYVLNHSYIMGLN